MKAFSFSSFFLTTKPSTILGGCFAFLIAGIALQVFFSPMAAILMLVFLVLGGVTLTRPLVTLTGLAIYLPFEPFLLKWVNTDVYTVVRYGAEGLIYVLCGVVLWKVLMRKRAERSSPLDTAFILFCAVLGVSVILNLVSPWVAVLGIRQIIRFMLVFFVAYHLRVSSVYLQRLTWVLFMVVALQSVLSVGQLVSQGALDPFLLPAQDRVVGDMTVTAGVDEFWEPGTRAFGTLGRYDRLGSFLMFFLLLMVGLLYERRMIKTTKELWYVLPFGLLALVLTYSRSAWFGFLFGFLFIALVIYRDRRVAWGVGLSTVVVCVFLLLSGLRVSVITESAGQSLAERFFETFSVARWQGEYYGLGRVYWMVQTPLKVVASSPFFGVGPGQFGGGAVAALGNTRVYEQLGLPFGVFGTEGSIDNNWWALWGETGTFGLLSFGAMYGLLFWYVYRLAHQKEADATTRALAVGFCGVMIGLTFHAFLATTFEVRTIAFYVWLYGGFLLGSRVQYAPHTS